MSKIPDRKPHLSKPMLRVLPMSLQPGDILIRIRVPAARR
jgi:hypothetical protein